jgi:hypothetical protein
MDMRGGWKYLAFPTIEGSNLEEIVGRRSGWRFKAARIFGP